MHGTRDMSLSPRDRRLSPRQATFCHSYVYFPNAAIRRGMADDGCRGTGVLLGKLENVYNRAIEDRHYVAAARTVEIQARLAGLMPSVNERLRDAAPGGPREPKGGGEPQG